MAQSLCVFGRLPKLSTAELESLYGADKLRPVGTQAAVLDIDPPLIDFSRLGGTIKFAKVLAVLDFTNWKRIESFLKKAIPQHLQYLPEGKMKLGLSVYGLDIPVQRINASALGLKKLIRSAGRSVRVVPNVDPALNSAQVLHNQLTGALGWELIFVRDGDKTIVAQNIAEQDIEAYAARDQARPKRDARVGMLPPKLAQTIVNLAVGYIGDQPVSASCVPDTQDSLGLYTTQGAGSPRREDSSWGAVKEERVSPDGSVGVNERQTPVDTAIRQKEERVTSPAREQALPAKAILDPFCGTGVILQEAALMGYDVYGTDIDERLIDYAKENLDWLAEKYPHCPFTYLLETMDATSAGWQPFDFVASEAYLGRPFSAQPKPDVLQDVMQNTNLIIKKFLKNLAKQTESGFRLCIAIPAWQTGKGFEHLPLLDSLTDIGYNRVSFAHVSNEDLIYFREGQHVARELLVLQRA